MSGRSELMISAGFLVTCFCTFLLCEKFRFIYFFVSLDLAPYWWVVARKEAVAEWEELQTNEIRGQLGQC